MYGFIMGKSFWIGTIIGLVAGASAAGGYMHFSLKAEREYSASLVAKINQDGSNSASTTNDKLSDKADSVTQEINADMTSILTKVFGTTKLASDTEVSQNSLLIYSVPRMVVSADIKAVGDQLTAAGYKNIQMGQKNIFAQKGQQFIANVSINSDLGDEGRFLIRVLIY